MTELEDFFIDPLINQYVLDKYSGEDLANAFDKLFIKRKHKFFDQLIFQTGLLQEYPELFLRKMFDKINSDLFRELYFLSFSLEVKRHNLLLSYIEEQENYKKLNFDSIVDFYNYFVGNGVITHLYNKPAFWENILLNDKIKAKLEGKNQATSTYINGPEHFWLNERYAKRYINITNDYFFNPHPPNLYEIFKKHNFDFNYANHLGETPLHLALTILIKFKDDPSFVKDYLFNIKELILAGGKIDIVNTNNKTFADIWKKNKNIKKIKQKINVYPQVYVNNQQEEINSNQVIDFIDSRVEEYLINKNLNKSLVKATTKL